VNYKVYNPAEVAATGANLKVYDESPTAVDNDEAENLKAELVVVKAISSVNLVSPVGGFKVNDPEKYPALAVNIVLAQVANFLVASFPKLAIEALYDEAAETMLGTMVPLLGTMI